MRCRRLNSRYSCLVPLLANGAPVQNANGVHGDSPGCKPRDVYEFGNPAPTGRTDRASRNRLTASSTFRAPRWGSGRGGGILIPGFSPFAIAVHPVGGGETGWHSKQTPILPGWWHSKQTPILPGWQNLLAPYSGCLFIRTGIWQCMGLPRYGVRREVRNERHAALAEDALPPGSAVIVPQLTSRTASGASIS